MDVLYLVLLIVGGICFAAAAFGKAVGSVNLVALGLLAWILVPLLQTFTALD